MQQRPPQASNGVIKPTDGALDRCVPARRKVIMDTAVLIKDNLTEGKDFDAFALCEEFTDADEKVALWSFLDSKQRRRLKDQAEAANKPHEHRGREHGQCAWHSLSTSAFA
jgi:antibiotic biosynthesis monooxygenase (ABM) superfamily enzyme